MSDDGFYYLHTNGDVIWKKFRPEDDSPFVKKVWPVDVSSRANGWLIAIEALAFGAKRKRIEELRKKWGLTNEDAQEFAKRTGLLLSKDGDQWFATFDDFENVQVSQVGFGETALDAFADLARGGWVKSETEDALPTP